MNALIPLAFALILINHKKIRTDQNYRFSVLSVVGIMFFFILKFVDYYFSLFSYGNFLQNTTRLAVVLITVAACLTPLLTKSSLVKANICISIFALSIFLSFFADRPIKIFIANQGGYFDELPKENLLYSDDVMRYISEEGGYSLLVPSYWKKKTTPDGMDYFVALEKNSLTLELRPRCFHGGDLVITEVVQNLQKSDAIGNRLTTSSCTREKDFHVCTVKSIGETSTAPIERWHWLAMNFWSQQNIEVDVLLFNNDDKIKQQIKSVFASIKIEPLKTPTPTCLSTVDWF